MVAIGSPFGLHNTVTAGIISALHRVMDPSQQYETFIQTDAPINPGNSGGPLVNLKGQVVGINTAIYTETDGYQGIGFALPSNLVGRIYPELLRYGRVTRGSIGVYFESSLSPAVRRVYHIERGVPLTEVAAHGPAARAGLEAGDVITTINGHGISDGSALMNAVEFDPIGASIQVGFLRAGKLHDARLRVANRARLYPGATTSSAAGSIPATAPYNSSNFGMVLANLAGGRGVRVEAVIPDSFADQIGVDADDVIMQVNRVSIHSRLQFQKLVATLRPGQDLALLLSRRGEDAPRSRWLVGGTLPPPLENRP